MSDQDMFERVLASLNDAMLDDTLWPATSALIDEACGTVGNVLLVTDGPKDDVRVTFAGLYYQGERRDDWAREYLERYHPIDERVPRLRQLPDSRLGCVLISSEPQAHGSEFDSWNGFFIAGGRYCFSLLKTVQ